MGVNRPRGAEVVWHHVGVELGADGVRFRARDDEHLGEYGPALVETDLARGFTPEQSHVLVRVGILRGRESELERGLGDAENLARAEQSHTRRWVP